MYSLNLTEEEKQYFNSKYVQSLKKRDDLEESILSCLIQQPSLINDLIVNENDFINHKKIFIYFKKFYERFHNLDVVLLMTNLKPSDRPILGRIYDDICEFEPAPSNFKLYQEALIEHNKDMVIKKEEEKKKIEIIKITQKLHRGDLNIKEWNEEIEKIKGEVSYE